MKILLVSEFQEGSLGQSYFNAFCSIGCETYKYDYMEELKKNFPMCKNKILNKIGNSFFLDMINNNLFLEVGKIRPDFILVLKGSLVFPNTIKKIRELLNMKIFCYNPDNPFNKNRGASNKFIRDSIPFYNAYFIWGEFLIPEIKNTGVEKVFYLPFACDPSLHYPVEPTEDERKIYGSDIAFIGTWDEEREYWLNYLKDFNLTIWGNSWKKLSLFSPLRKKWRKKAVFGDEFSKICNSSKIIINIIRKQNGSAHNMRTFEVPACKGFMLTKRTKEQCSFFEENKDTICYETPEELISKIVEWLPKEEERKTIQENSYAKVQKYTYKEKAQEILKIITNLL